MSVLAHFTPTELPGTIAVLLIGVSIGALVAARRTAGPAMLAVGAALLVFAALGYAGDALGWAEGVRVAIDVMFLGAAACLAALIVRLAGWPG